MDGPDADWQGWNRTLSLERRLQASYEAARQHDDLWTLADFADADAALLPEKRRLLRSHSRYEAANNPIIDRILKVWVADLAGPEGPWLSVAGGDARADRLIEAAWAKWWRRNGLAAKLHCAVRAEAVDGEHVALRLRVPSQISRAGVSLDVLPLECDRLANPDWSNANTSDYIDGVHLDPFTRRPVAYDILKAHPGTEYLDQTASIYEARTFPASDILHAFRAVRPEQHRGVPRPVPALTLTGMHRKFLAAKVDKAALQAAIAFAIKSMAPGEPESAGDDGTHWQTVRLPSRQGLGILFPDGYEPVQFKTDGDSQDVDPFNRIICGLYAGCFSMPLGRAMGEYGGSGYAQIRAGLIPYEKALCADRCQVWEPLWLDPLYEDFMVEFRLMAPMQELLATFSIEDRRSLDLHNIQWNWGFGDLVVDPSRERSAQEKKLRLGLSTREAELEAPDIDAHDRRAAVQLGIVDDTGAPDIMRYRRIVAQSIHGVPVEEAGNHRAGSPAPDDEGDKPDTARLQANCGTGKGGFQSGNTCAKKHGGSGGDSSRGKRIAKALAISVGIALARTVVRRVEIAVAQRLVNLLMKGADRAIGVDLQAEASIGDPLLREVNELIKDRQLSRRIVRQVRRRRRRKRISAESPPAEDPEPARIEANCGTGKGGFQSGNSCAKRGSVESGGAGNADAGRRDAILLKSKRFAAIVEGLEKGTLRNMENGEPIPRDRRLSPIEQAAIVEYTHRPAARKLNRFLRNGPENFGKAMNRSQSARVHALKAALEKLPPVGAITWRGLPSEFIEPKRNGSAYIDAAFLSTTTNRAHPELKRGLGRAIMKVEGRAGRTISHTSLLPSEREVLFPPATEFRVNSRRRTKTGTLYVTLREV